MSTAIHSTATSAVFSRDANADSPFAADFDHRPFQFRHSLDAMDIFKMPALLDLADRCMRKRQHKIHFETGEPVVDGARKIGLHPTVPGRKPALDRAKNLTFGKLYEGARAARTALKLRFGI
jgi:hypothetical protein